MPTTCILQIKEKPIIVILTEDFYKTEEYWPSEFFNVVDYAYPNMEEWLKWESQKCGIRLNDQLRDFLTNEGGNNAFRKVNQWDWLRMSNSMQMGHTLLDAVEEATLYSIDPTGVRQSLYEDIKSYTHKKKAVTGKKPIIDNNEALRLIDLIQQGDAHAENELAELGTVFIKAVAKKYRGKGLTDEELVAASCHGMLRASHKFDKSRGFKFAAYAVWWMREAILQKIKKNI